MCINNKSSSIIVHDSYNCTVAYYQDKNAYRLSTFENGHFQEEYWFQAYMETGHWIDHGYEIECSVCGFTCNDEWYLGEAVACPNCGVHMDGREDVTNIQYE